VMRDYLVVTRGVDPVELERARMAHVSVGWPGPAERDPLAEVVYTCMQEVATRIAHRNTGRACGDPVADRMLARVARDENLHQLFYRNVLAAAFDREPDYAMWAVSATVQTFTMPGVAVEGFRRAAAMIARAGIYDLAQHESEVVRPLLRHWRVFERDDFGPTGERLRDELASWLDNRLAPSVSRFLRSQERARERRQE
jgi:acyl-[acyl-carrier-protein] desaturase